MSFDGTANINLPGVNTTGNQNTTGNAATATKLQTARTINGVSFDGSANISLSPANIGCPASPTGWLTTGSNGGAITTAQLVTLLQNNGAFNTKAWIARCAWAYANSATIPNSETGCGVIPLAGAVIEVFNNGSSSNNYTIRITTATTTSVSGALTNAEFIYVFNGTDYSPGWRRVYNTKNKPTASDVGALPLTGGTLSGGLTSSGEIVSKYANGFRIAYGSFGFFIRNDGGSTYFMLTASGDTLGSWNGLRPITINNTSGVVSIGNGLNVTGGINGSLNGNASTATKLQTARNINGVKFDGSGDININTLVSRGRVTALSGSTQGTAGIQMYEAYNNSYPTTYGNVLHMKGASAAGEGELLIGWSGTSGAHAPVFIRSRRDTTDAAWSAWAQVYTAKDSIPGVNTTGNQNTTGNAATATKLQTARKIAGVAFDGSADINLPGVNIAGNQNTTGNAATATKLQTACTINGVSFDGSKNIELTAEDLNLEQTVELAAGSLQKNQNGADIPDKDRFLSNINVYSKGEVDKKKGMRQYAFNAPSNAVGGKWYPVIFRRSTGSTGELASRVIITTTSAGGNYEMNNCEFNGMVMPGGWTDRGSYAAGYFSTYQTNERAIHSIVTSLKEDDVCSVFYVEGRAFPVRVSAEEGLTVIVPTQDYTVGQTTYKWGATNPATESTNAQAILDFNNGRGFYCSHSIFGINAIFSGNLGIGTANALGGNSIVLGDNDTGFKQNGDGVLDAYANGVHVFRFRNGSAISLKGIQTGESKLFTLSSSNTAARNASFNLWGNSSRPTVAELGDDSGWHFYSQRNTDNSVIFSVNGQIQPNNWGNFDSRYVKDVRLGTRVVQTMRKGVMYEKSGHVITGLGIIGAVDGDDPAVFRPIQKYINGTWYNVAQV
ncbi:hypothetical protein [Escherichia coli]|uniref:phage tail fiber protein n=1 Tax=Escherichia coli TaxID=562 RepID=UPI003F4F3166